MPTLTMRTQFDLQLHSREQSKTTEEQDTALEHGKIAVDAMFRGAPPSDSVALQLTEAFARIERCRQQDTLEEGGERPRPMTLSPLQSGEVHESVADLPQRVGGFDIDPDGRTDARGRPLNKFDEDRGIWEPVYYKD